MRMPSALLSASRNRRLLLAAAGIALAGGGVLLAQRPMRQAGSVGDAGPAVPLWISAHPVDDQRQMLIVIDPALKNAAIYHVDTAAGTLTLKSSRDISWDLMLGDFNAQDPKPAALRRMIEVGPATGPSGQTRP